MRKIAEPGAPAALVVDDNPVVLLDAVAIFEDARFCVFSAHDSGEALRQLEQRADSIVIAFINIELSGSISGIKLAQHIADTYPWVALLITSALAEPKSDEMPDDAAFVSKPYSSEQVIKHARLVLVAKGVDLL